VRLHATVKEFFAERASDAGAVHRALASWYAGQQPAGEPTSLAEVRPRVLAVDHALAGGDAEHAAALLFSPYTPSYTFTEWLSAWGHHAEGIRLMGRVGEAVAGSTKALCLLGRASLHLETRRATAALTDLTESISILEGSLEAGRAADRRNLARALIARGSALREIAETSKGLADLDWAVTILEEGFAAQQDLRLDLARALVQRAHAAWELGRWSAALRDHNRAEQVATQSPSLAPAVLSLFLAELRANRGVVHADLGERSAAILDFEGAISCYAPLVDAGRRDLGPRLGHAQVMLATEWTSAGRADAAIPLLERTLGELTLQVHAGRIDAEALQVLARMALAAAWLAAGRSAESLPQAEEAVAGYRRIVDAGAPQYAGLLANSLFTCAAARHAAGDRGGSRTARDEAFAVVRRLGEEWRDESDARLVLLRKQVEALRYLLPAQAEDTERLLAETLAGVEHALRNADVSEGLRIEARRTLAALLDLRPGFSAAGIASDGLTALQTSLQ
jgi:tetratricopeptide (TPR) repeat protein